MESLKYDLSKSIALFRTSKINNIDSKYVHTSEFSVLIVIYNSKKEISSIDIAKYLGFSKVYASKVINYLLDRKLIYKKVNEKDKRQYFLYMTEEGKKIVAEHMAKYMETTDYLYSQLGEEKVKELIILLDEATKILKYYEKSKENL